MKRRTRADLRSSRAGLWAPVAIVLLFTGVLALLPLGQAGPSPPAPDPAAPGKLLSTILDYQVTLTPDRAKLTACFSGQILDVDDLGPINVFPGSAAWKKVQVNGKPAQLRLKDGWLVFEPAKPGHYTVSAETELKIRVRGAVSSIALPRPPTLITRVTVDTDQALKLSVVGAAGPLTGTKAAGTHGRLGLRPNSFLTLLWTPAWAAPTRPSRIFTQTFAGFDLGDKTIDLRARLVVTLSGGATDSLPLSLPAGADRISVTGPDVVQYINGRVQLRERMIGQTVLTVTATLPRQPGQPVRLTGPTLAKARATGGELVVAADHGVQLIEEAVTGAKAVEVDALSESTRGLVTQAPARAYRLGRGAWQVRLDPVATGAFSTADTIVDDAAYLATLRPDGSLMVRATFTLRNMRRPFLNFTMPKGARLVSVRVNEQEVRPIHRPGGPLRVPMMKSIESGAGMISFSLEVAYLVRSNPFVKVGGKYTLALPRPDVPVAYARLAVYLPMEVDPGDADSFTGLFKRVEQFSMEQAEAELTYGRGYVEVDTAGTVQGAPIAPPKAPDDSEGLMNFSLREARGGRREVGQRGYYRAGMKAYSDNRFDEAEALFEEAVKINPKSPIGLQASGLFWNSRLAQGKVKFGNKNKGSKKDAAKAGKVRTQIRGRNLELLAKQKSNVDAALNARRDGDEEEEARRWFQAGKQAEELAKRGEAGTRQQEIHDASKQTVDRYRRALKVEEAWKEKSRAVAEKRLGQLKEKEWLMKKKYIGPGQGKGGGRGKGRGDKPGDGSKDSDYAFVSGPDLKRSLDEIQDEKKSLEEMIVKSKDRSGWDPDAAVAGPAPTAEGTPARRPRRARDARFTEEANESARLQLQKLEARLKEHTETLGKLALDNELNLNELRKERIQEELDLRLSEMTSMTEKLQTYRAPERLREQNEVDALNKWVDSNRSNWTATDEDDREWNLTFDRIAGDGKDGARLGVRFEGATSTAVSGFVDAFQVHGGKKLRVSSYNSRGRLREVTQVGGQWQGDSALHYAILDPGQVEALLEQDALGGGLKNQFDFKQLRQETLVGSQARLANDMTLHVAAAATSNNRLVILGHSLVLPHNKSLALANGDGTFTLVQAGRLHEWGATIEEPEPFIAPAPRAELPEVGHLIRLEKLLPTDDEMFTVTFAYRWKGE